MDFFLLSATALAVVALNRYVQAQRIALLSIELGKFQIEKLMETTADGYLRALGETDLLRRAQIWNMLGQAESNLSGQVQAFAKAFAQCDEEATRFSTLPVAVPYAQRWLPFASADMRALVRMHAQGIDAVAANSSGLNQKDRAFMLTAELLLFQHSCHWFCRSKVTANARMMARHKTPHAQLLSSVSAQTREAYLQLVN
jgi:hypothetical protein